MASCRYCGIAHVNTEPRCASCGAPKAAADIHWLKKEERQAVLETLQAELLAKKTVETRKFPAWGWIALLILFGPFLIPMFLLSIVMLFAFGSMASPLLIGALIWGGYHFYQSKKKT